MRAARGPEPRSNRDDRLEPSQVPWPADAIADPNYLDAFEVQVPMRDGAAAEEWMRRALEGAPAALRLFIAFGWRFVLGLRPARSTSILGWPIVEATDEWVLLEQRSRLVAADLLLRKTPGGLTWGTRVRFESRLARPVWAAVGVLHRRIVPYLLRRAVAGSAGS